MRMKKAFFLCSFCLALSAQANSDDVLLHECNFDNGIPTEYATYDLDQQTHHYTMVQAGLDTGKPWTALRERGTDGNYYAASTSKYKVPKGEEAQPANDWLVTPGMRIPTAKTKITWRAQSLCENVMKGDTYEVRVSTTGNKPEDFVDAPVITIETETINQWTEHTADLSQYADQYVHIAFVNRTHAGEILAIDDIRISSSHSAYEVIRAIDTHVFGTEEHTLAGILRSNSVDGINKFTACCLVNGKEYRRDFADVDINSGEDFRFEFPETFSAAYGDTLHYRMWVDIEGYRPDTLDASFVSMLFRPARRTIAEEGTGMWCGYCPLGTVAMDRMKKKYPDTFIGIAAHYDDILEVEGYIRQFHLSSYPMFLVNRKYEAAPMVLAQINGKTDYTTMEGAIETALLHEQSQVTTADVRLTSSEVDKMISVQAEACFAIHEDNADYRWAFVVVEDGMEDTKFYQANYMSGRTEYNLDGYENKAERIYPYTFNDVALSIAGQLNGFEGSVPTKLKAGDTYTFQHQFKVSNMQNPNNVRIIAMLLDAQGHVVNATQTPLHTTGITTTPNDSSLAPIIGYYSLDGRRFSTPIRGINIIRRADGSTQKVIR